VQVIVIFLILATVSVSAFAQATAQSSELKEKTVVNENIDQHSVVQTSFNESFMDAWGIDEEEYERYLHLKENSPRGYFTPGKNPLYFLGIEARTPQERKKYARKIAQLEFENVMKVQEFSKAVQVASVELYGRGMIADYNSGKAFSADLEAGAKNKIKNSFSLNSSGSGDLAISKIVYVKHDCAPCEREYSKAYSELIRGEIKQLQVVFPEENNAEIIKWAKAMEVPRDLNRKGVIVLRGLETTEEAPSEWPSVSSRVL